MIKRLELNLSGSLTYAFSELDIGDIAEIVQSNDISYLNCIVMRISRATIILASGEQFFENKDFRVKKIPKGSTILFEVI